MIDAYRSPAGRDAVQRWCSAELERWPVPTTGRDLRVPVSSGSRPGAVDTHVTILGDGPPDFLWLPGTAMSAASSPGSLLALAERGTVWALDLPGQPGLSQGSRPRLDATSWYSSWLTGVLDVLAAEGDGHQVALVASGAGAAAGLSTSHPLVRSRLLVAPGGLLPPALSPVVTRDLTRWSLRATPVTTRAVVRHFVAPGAPLPEQAVAWFELVGRACKTVRFPRPLPQHYLDSIDDTPLTVVVGDEDAIVPAAPLAALLPRRTSARVVVMEGLGHLVPDDRWDQVLRLLT